MRNIILAASALTLAVPAIPSAALAHQTGYSHSHRGQSSYRDYRQNYRQDYCKKGNGTTGLVVGGAAGALAGRAIDTRGERTTGTILGAAVGALLGRHVDRNVVSKKCRY
jgi:outer membrane lipoprotein SlyB